jgi:hypothetical protein
MEHQASEGLNMAKNGFKVFDSDMHIVEPADLWERYIECVAEWGLN